MNEDGTVGGSHQAMFDLITNLDRRRFQPVALYYQDQSFARRLADAGVEVHVWDRQRQIERGRSGFVGKTASGVGAVRARARFLRTAQIDLLHANNAPHVGYRDWLPAAVLAGIPAIAHSRGPYVPPRNPGSRWLTRRWNCVIAISGFVEQSLLDAGFPRRRVRKVFDGVDVERFTASVRTPPSEVRARLRLSPEHFVVVMVGNIKRWKGQSVVLDGLSHLNEDLRGKTRVLFVGDVEDASPAAGDPFSGPRVYYEELERIVEERQLAGSVRFLGWRDDVPDLMNAADVVVHASTSPEPFGLVVVEAMALGKPVVAADSGGPAEILTAGSGLTFDPQHPQQLAHALGQLASDAALRRALSVGACRRVEAFGIDHTLRAIEALYGELLGVHVQERSEGAEWAAGGPGARVPPSASPDRP